MKADVNTAGGPFVTRAEELGYPHELILLASNRTASVVKGEYRVRIKLLANILNVVLNRKPDKIKAESESDPELSILESLGQSSRSLGKHLSAYKVKIDEALRDFEETESDPSYVVLADLLNEGIFLHILCKELRNTPLFLERDLSKYSGTFNNKDSGLQAVFSAVQIWESRKYDSVPQNIIAEFNSFKDDALLRAAMYLSYMLAVRTPKNKRELLISHYMLVRKIVGKLKEVVNQENLADQVLENLFRTAIILSLCGYLTALRLPKDEKTRYIDEIIHVPSIEYSIKQSYDEVASVSLPHTQSRVPLWAFLLLDSLLILLHFFVEVYLPWEISQIGFKLAIPDVPVFLVLALITTVFVLFRLYKLRSNLLRNFRRGAIE
jgi:hypothetical protein